MTSLYEFVDTNEMPNMTTRFPDEAVNINGVFLDYTIGGFTTVTVSGRDSLSYDIASENAGSSGTGELFLGKRLESRYLTIKFKLVTSSASDLIAKFTTLKTHLSGDLIVKFNDDINKYYKGTLSEIDNPPEGALTFVSSFEIYCADPICYSENPKGPYTATRGADGRYSVTVVNEGNVAASITMTATMNAENGYVGMYTDYGITEIGNKEEDNTEDYVSATTILNTTNFTEFKRYTGINPENSRKGNDGTSKLVSESGINYWRLDNPGTDNGYWHGSSYVFDFPADGTGHVGSKNVYSYFNAVFWAGAMGQTADMQIFFLDKDNKFVMGYDIYKQDTNGNIGVYAMLVGDGKGNAKLMKAIPFTTSHQDNENPFNRPRGPSDIRKRGDKITFHWWGSYPEFVVPELKNVEITKCMINQYQLGNRSGSKLMSYFDFRNLLIVNDDAQYVRDIKNRYPEGTKVTVTGADSKIQVNGMMRLTEKVDGSNLFTIPPGETVIYFQCSDWCTTAPTYQIEFSEANL